MRISYWSSDVCSSDLPSRQRNRPCCLQLGIFRSQTPGSPPPSAARTAGSRASLGLFGGLLGIRAVGVLEHMHEARNRIPAAPVTLQLAIELGLADELTTRLLDPAQCGLVRGARGAADRIRNDIDLVTFLQCVERRESQIGRAH